MDPEVEDFWCAYALRRVKRFRRIRGKAYEVEFATRGGDGMSHAWRCCSLPWEGVEQASDPRERFHQFGLLCHESLAEALAALVSSPLMNEDSALNRSRLNLFPVSTQGKDYQRMRNAALRHLREKGVSCDDLVDAVERHTPGAKQLAEFKRTGDGRRLGRERELAFMAMGLFVDGSGGVPKEFVELLHAVLRNYANEHSDVLRSAIWALGRANHKASIAELVSFLHRTGEGLSFTAGAALQMLCSGQRMIPIPVKDSATYWEREWEKVAERTLSSWQAQDCKSVFWETRLRSVFSADRKQIVALREDEIWPVRNAANSIELVEVRLTNELVDMIRQLLYASARKPANSSARNVKLIVRDGKNNSFRGSDDLMRVLSNEVARKDGNENDLKRSNERDCPRELAGARHR